MKWVKWNWFLLVAGVAFGVLIILGYAVKSWGQWMGIIVDPVSGRSPEDYRTLWEWLDLLIIPAVLALGGWWLNKTQRETELQIAQEQRAEDYRIAEAKNQTDKQIAKDRNQQALLDGYFDRMTSLILEKGLKDPDSGNEIRNIARTHTLSVLRNLDGKRKGQVLSFLNETGLIQKQNHGQPPPMISLHSAELRGADLIMIPLRELYDANYWTPALVTRLIKEDYDKYLPGTTKTWSADLRDCALKDADLSYAAFILTDLSGTDFDEANLNGAILVLANLWLANLRYASLRGADLRRAKLPMAILDGADLQDANLEEAEVTDEQLKSAKSLENATMPNGVKYHPDFFSAKK
ncbi:MAG: pentapeptide repeat-containing protein [Anaerolineae bacterium]|nr:pentapeptide repeat-containing protein [Anaerolineae bacterium]